MFTNIGMIWPNHRVWTIILTPPFEPIDLKKMEMCSLSLGLGLRHDIFCSTKVCMVPYFLCSRTQSSNSFKHGHGS